MGSELAVLEGAECALQVAHRVDTVLACDLVAVMEAGRVVEIGQPQALLQKADSWFAGLHAADQGDV